MKIVIQRVSKASVSVQGEIVGAIGKGFLALLGVEEQDDFAIAGAMAEKIAKLRVFADDEGKTNLSSGDVGGEILTVSQFTLCADCRKGNRPSFTGAGSPVKAKEIFEYFADKCQGLFSASARGVFGAEMEISLVNDGPFTLVLNSGELGIHGNNAKR